MNLWPFTRKPKPEIAPIVFDMEAIRAEIREQLERDYLEARLEKRRRDRKPKQDAAKRGWATRRGVA